MTQHDALFAAVLANPDDDLPRLVLADWFEEHGESERAEFIRAQIEMAKLWRPPFPKGGTKKRARVIKLGARECDLMHILAHDGLKVPARFLITDQPWRAKPREHPTARNIAAVVFERGFGSLVACELVQWMEYGPMLMANHPVKKVEFSDCEPYAARSLEAWFWIHSSNIYADRRGSRDSLPDELWKLDAISRPIPGNRSRGAFWFKTLEDAHDALSVAALTWAGSVVVAIEETRR